MTEQELQEIRERLEIALFEIQIGKPVEFSAKDGMDMALLLVEVKGLRKALEEIRETYKAEGYGPFIDEIARKALEGGTE